jgi:hypothetical protein
MTVALPRYVIAKRLASGRIAFYYNLPKKYRDLGCAVANTPLGTDYTIACDEDGNDGRAAALNAAFDEWNTVRHGLPVTSERAPIYGTIRWLFQEYRRSKAYLEKVAPRSRRDYERTMQLIESIVTKKGDELGDRQIRSVTPISADKIYGNFWLVLTAIGRGKRKRRWRSAGVLGASSTGCIPANLTGVFQIRGMALPSSAA